MWVNTLDRTFRKDGATWKPFDVPGVTGQAVDIFHIASNGRGGVYLSATNGIHAFDGTAWKAVTMPRDLKIGYAAAVVPGPGGRFAYATAENQVYFGDTSSGLHPLDAKSAGVETYRLAPEEIDDRGRIWATDGAGVIVFDTAGKVVRHWRPEEVPVFTSKPIRIAVHLGGPAQLQSGERATATITGKIEGSAPGLKLVACAQATPEYDKEPCQGIATARRATTSAGGRFTLEGVPLGPLNFWVQRGGRWRPMKGTACCADVPPDGTFEVGTLAYAQ